MNHCVLTFASIHGIPVETIGAQATETAICVQAIRIASARCTGTLIEIDTTLFGTTITIVSRRAVAAITALEICTYGTGSANIGVCAFIDILATIIGIAHKALGAGACVVARRIDALSMCTAGQRIAALVHIRAQHFTIARIAVLALAQEMRWQIATLGILYATRCYRWILAFVNVCEERERGRL